LQLIFARKGPKQKVATTEIVNQVEPLLDENVRGYLAGPRTASSQRQAIENFKAGWQFVLENCGAEVMGEPGRRCILERQEGARPAWGANWFELYLDPIRNDPDVKRDTVSSTLNAAGLPDIFTPAPAGGGILQSKVLGLPMALVAAGLVLVMATTADGNK
jgi:hypothetical protein